MGQLHCSYFPQFHVHCAQLFGELISIADPYFFIVDTYWENVGQLVKPKFWNYILVYKISNGLRCKLRENYILPWKTGNIIAQVHVQVALNMPKFQLNKYIIFMIWVTQVMETLKSSKMDR